MMEKIDKVYFIKTKVFEILLQPKSKGEFEIGPSEFGYYITKNQSDYMDNLEPFSSAAAVFPAVSTFC